MQEQDPFLRSPLDVLLARNVREIRHSLDMTQAEFAAAIGEAGLNGPSRISELELAKNSLTLKTLYRLANCLGVDPLDLLRRHEIPLSTTLQCRKVKGGAATRSDPVRR